LHQRIRDLLLQLSSVLDANSRLSLQLKEVELNLGCWMMAFEMPLSHTLFIVLVALLIGVFVLCGCNHLGLYKEVLQKQAKVAKLEAEIQAEFGNMVQVGDSLQVGELGSDFGFCIFDTEINQESVRLLKIQCPGVKHADVEVELVFNGCDVTIRRQPSRGVPGVTWHRRFQFRPSDGLYEFREEQMQLEEGFLQLVFRACAFQSRLVLFPRYFSLAASDADACWDYPLESEVEQLDEAAAWWQDDVSSHELPRNAPTHSNILQTEGAKGLGDVDTESTASTARQVGV